MRCSFISLVLFNTVVNNTPLNSKAVHANLCSVTRWTLTLFFFLLVSDLSKWHFIGLIGRSGTLHFAVMLIVLAGQSVMWQRHPLELRVHRQKMWLSLLPWLQLPHSYHFSSGLVVSLFYQVLFSPPVAPSCHWMLLLLRGGLGLSSTETLGLLVSLILA